jgi:hypothetical protein
MNATVYLEPVSEFLTQPVFFEVSEKHEITVNETNARRRVQEMTTKAKGSGIGAFSNWQIGVNSEQAGELLRWRMTDSRGTPLDPVLQSREGG